MPGQFYSDKYIKHRRGAEKAQDQQKQAKLVAEQAMSEEREAQHRFTRRQGKNWPDSTAVPEKGENNG